MSKFKIGDRVKCIKDELHAYIDSKLKRNLIYTIEKMDHQYACLKEDGMKLSWRLDRFVKVDCLKIKIRKLKRLLEK